MAGGYRRTELTGRESWIDILRGSALQHHSKPNGRGEGACNEQGNAQAFPPRSEHNNAHHREEEAELEPEGPGTDSAS